MPALESNSCFIYPIFIIARSLLSAQDLIQGHYPGLAGAPVLLIALECPFSQPTEPQRDINWTDDDWRHKSRFQNDLIVLSLGNEVILGSCFGIMCEFGSDRTLLSFLICK